MSRRIEELLKSYPEMVQKRNCLAYQLAHFKGLSAEEVIESMYTPRQDGERVQTSTLSDKTAQIAMVYQERQERMDCGLRVVLQVVSLSLIPRLRRQ